MLLAKVALALCGTLVLTTAYAFHEGVLRVDEDQSNGRHVHVWVPAAIVPPSRVMSTLNTRPGSAGNSHRRFASSPIWRAVFRSIR